MLKKSKYHRELIAPFQSIHFPNNAVELPDMRIGEHRLFLSIKMKGTQLEVVSEDESTVTFRSMIPGYQNMIVSYFFKNEILSGVMQSH